MLLPIEVLAKRLNDLDTKIERLNLTCSEQQQRLDEAQQRLIMKKQEIQNAADNFDV